MPTWRGLRGVVLLHHLLQIVLLRVGAPSSLRALERLVEVVVQLVQPHLQRAEVRDDALVGAGALVEVLQQVLRVLRDVLQRLVDAALNRLRGDRVVTPVVTIWRWRAERSLRFLQQRASRGEVVQPEGVEDAVLVEGLELVRVRLARVLPRGRGRLVPRRGSLREAGQHVSQRLFLVQ